MSLKTQLKKLEELAGKGAGCAVCKLALSRTWSDPAKPTPAPEDILTLTCEFCGGIYTHSIAGQTDRDRAITVLSAKFSSEQIYTDRKCFALALRNSVWPERRKKRKAAKIRREQAKPGALGREYLKAREESRRVVNRRHKQLKQQYGEPFPDVVQLFQVVAERKSDIKSPDNMYVPDLHDLEREWGVMQGCLEMERIIWGEVWPESLADIAALEDKMRAMISAKVEAERQREEAARVRLEESNRRHDEMVARSRSSSTPAPKSTIEETGRTDWVERLKQSRQSA